MVARLSRSDDAYFADRLYEFLHSKGEMNLILQGLNDHSKYGLMGGRETIRDEEGDQDGLLRMPGATLPGMIGSKDRAVVSTTQHNPIVIHVHDDTTMSSRRLAQRKLSHGYRGIPLTPSHWYGQA